MFTFQFLNEKIHNYVKKKHNCEFIQKLKSKHTFSLVLREREEKKPKYFAPYFFSAWDKSRVKWDNSQLNWMNYHLTLSLFNKSWWLRLISNHLTLFWLDKLVNTFWTLCPSHLLSLYFWIKKHMFFALFSLLWLANKFF